MADKPNTPAQAETRKLMSYAELVAMKVADLAGYCKKIVVVTGAITKAQEAFTKKLKFNCKVVAALKRAHAEKRDAREIPGDWTFKDYFKNVAGGDLPSRVESMAVLFNSLVLTVDAQGKPLLSEENFDAAADDWLEKSCPIVKAAQKDHGDQWKTCDDVLDLVNALSKPGDALKTIKEIRARQKGEKTEAEQEAEKTAASAAQPLTVGRAIEFLKAAMRNGGNMIAAGKADETYDLYVATFTLTDTWLTSGVPEATLNAWTEKLDAAEKLGVAPHLEILKPVETPAPATPAPEPPPAATGKKPKAKVLVTLAALPALVAA